MDFHYLRSGEKMAEQFYTGQAVVAGSIFKPLKRLDRYGTQREYATMNRGVGLRTGESNTTVYCGGRTRESKDKLLQQFPLNRRIECQRIPM